MKTNVISQKEAVFRAVRSVTKGKGLTDDAKQKIYSQLENGFKSGKIELRLSEGNLVKLADERALRNYIIGLVANWLRKDDRFKKKAA